MSYGIFSDALPLFVGEEQVLVFEKMLSYNAISDRFKTKSPAARYYKEIKISPPWEYPFVFVDHSYIPSIYGGWTGGGTGNGGGINISDVVFFGTYTDSQVVYRPDGWYLIVFKPDGGNSSYNANYYVFKSLDQVTNKRQEPYGVNIYSTSGKLLYHSGWGIVRLNTAINVTAEIFRGQPRGPNGRGTLCLGLGDGNLPRDILAIEGKKINVGPNKLVSVGYVRKFTRFMRRTGYDPSAAYSTAVISGGFLFESISYATPGINTDFEPRMYAENVGAVLNPIMIIDKPKV